MTPADRKAFLTPPPGLKLPALPNRRIACAGRMTSFEPVLEPPVHPRNPKLVITIAVGPSRKILEYSEPAMRRYAEKIGADFFAITNRTQAWACAEKFRLGYYGEWYERTLFIDADIFIRDNAPDIFETVPPGSIGAHDDSYELESNAKGFAGTKWLDAELKALGESQGVEMMWGCFNSGVIVFDRADADLWTAPAKPFPVFHCSEQHWVQNNILRKGRTFYLPSEFNWQFWFDMELAGIERAHFVHLAGCGQLQPKMTLPLMRALALR